MSLSDQENCGQPTDKRKKKKGSTRPFALSQSTREISPMEVDSALTKPVKRLSSEADETVTKKTKSQGNEIRKADDEDSSQYANSSAGVLKSVKLINFMCHSHFEINFNSRINFISGCNGSGKSAIQTAIVIGLGGVASKTNRSSKIDGLIKHGCHSGTVTIVLSNYGWNAYKPKEYGNSIQITRHMTASSSTYKIHNQWGKLMASSKKELENILTRFRIQPNNPVSVLNQDMARNFLSTNKAESKYALFRKATLLDEAEELLAKVADEILEQESRMEVKKKAIELIEGEIAKMDKQLRLVQRLKEQKEKKFELENELAWSKVNSCRNDIDKMTDILTEQIKLKGDLEVGINELQARETELKEQKKKYEDDIAIIQEESKNKEETRQRIKHEFRMHKKQYEDTCSNYDSIETRIKNRRRERANLKRGLDDTQRADLEQKQRKQEAVLQKSKVKDELDLFEKQMKVLEGEASRLQSTMDHYNEEASRKRRSVQECRDQIGHCERAIQALGGKSDNLSMYDTFMPTLVQKINDAVKANKFSKPPRGPLGRYVKVKNEKWIYAIESNLGVAFLSSFLVNNSKDRDVLYSIMNQVIGNGRKPTVHCSAFQERKRDDMLPKIETSSPGHSNMLRALTINDVVVTNFLIDYNNIQRILLVEKDEECRNFVSRDENIPAKCRMILNLGADQFLPGYRVYANQDRNRRSRILRKSAADQMRGLKEEIAEKQEFIAKLMREIDECRHEGIQCLEKIKKITPEKDNLKSRIIENRIKMKNLVAVIEMEAPSLQMKLDEIKEIEIELKRLEREEQTVLAERNEAERKMQESKNRMQTENQDDFFAQQTQLNVDREKIAKEHNTLNMKIATMRKKMDEQNQKIFTLNTRIRDATAKLANEENSASQISEQLETQRSTAEIQREITEIETFVEEAKRKLGDEDMNFERQYWGKRESLKSFKGTFAELANLHTRMKHMHEERKISIEKTRDVNATTIMGEFQSVLKSRNYRGTLKFDHVNRKLDIMMAPIDGGDTMMNTSSLSGGEKSYSTVAFLLALWCHMELPFYSMDEYDVFMDAINRKTITKLLMSFAEKKNSRQFIFLTPLDISIIQPGAHVQVHRINKIQS